MPKPPPAHNSHVPIKVAFIVYGSIDQMSGGYLYDRRVVSALRSRGDSVEVFGLSKLPYLLAPFQGLGPMLKTLFRGPGRRGEPSEGPPTYDCIVVDELVHPSVWLARFGRRARKDGVVTLVHHLRSQERIPAISRAVARAFERVLLNRSSLIITTGAATADKVRSLLTRYIPVLTCMPGRNSLPVPTGASARQTARKAGEPCRILSVGILVPRKGYRRLVQALSSMKELPWECTIVGDDSIDPRYAARLRGLVERSGLGALIRITGRIADAELAELYRNAHVFAFPSELEGYGIVLAEAMSFGIPYAAFRGGALPELIGREEIFFSSPEGRIIRAEGGLVADKPPAFARALKTLITDERLRRRFAGEAANRALFFPTWDATGRCFSDALLKAVRGAHSGRPVEGR
jgi:glycosyltransferase involved in cell wall biosynthesis